MEERRGERYMGEVDRRRRKSIVEKTRSENTDNEKNTDRES